jgi:hypothetical protein
MEKPESFIATPELVINIKKARRDIGNAELIEIPNSPGFFLVRVGTQALQERIDDKKMLVFPLAESMPHDEEMPDAENFCLCMG